MAWGREPDVPLPEEYKFEIVVGPLNNSKRQWYYHVFRKGGKGNEGPFGQGHAVNEKEARSLAEGAALRLAKIWHDEKYAVEKTYDYEVYL